MGLLCPCSLVPVVLGCVVLAAAGRGLLGQFHLQSGPLQPFLHFYINLFVSLPGWDTFSSSCLFSLQSLAVFIPLPAASFLTYMIRRVYHARRLVFSPPTIHPNPHAWEKQKTTNTSSASPAHPDTHSGSAPWERLVAKLTSWSRRLLPSFLPVNDCTPYRHGALPNAIKMWRLRCASLRTPQALASFYTAASKFVVSATKILPC